MTRREYSWNQVSQQSVAKRIKRHDAPMSYVEKAIYDMGERIGEPAWFSDLRERLLLACERDCPLERLAILGPRVKGESPYDDSGHIVSEPASVSHLRCEWERELTPDDLPPGVPIHLGMRPAVNGPTLRKWQAELYASLARDD